MRTIATIEGEPITLRDDGSIFFRAKAAIDCDGTSPHHGDPCAQSDTSLHVDGRPLNADVDRYIVVPPAIIVGVPGIVLGCRAHVRHTVSGLETEAVVGDVGPRPPYARPVGHAAGAGDAGKGDRGGAQAGVHRAMSVPETQPTEAPIRLTPYGLRIAIAAMLADEARGCGKHHLDELLSQFCRAMDAHSALAARKRAIAAAKATGAVE